MMADWIDKYPWMGLIDLADVAHLYENGRVSFQVLLESFGVTEEEWRASHAEVSGSEGVLGDEGERSVCAGRTSNGVREEPSGTEDS